MYRVMISKINSRPGFYIFWIKIAFYIVWEFKINEILPKTFKADGRPRWSLKIVLYKSLTLETCFILKTFKFQTM